MAEVRTYVYQGRKITVAEAAMLAGVSDQTIYNRLKSNGGDIELAILGGGNRPMKLPDVEPNKKTAKAPSVSEKKETLSMPKAAEVTERLLEIVGIQTTAGDERKESLRRLNDAINALRCLRDDDMAEDVVITKVRELILKLDAMRAWMYSDMIDWDALAREE